MLFAHGKRAVSPNSYGGGKIGNKIAFAPVFEGDGAGDVLLVVGDSGHIFGGDIDYGHRVIAGRRGGVGGGSFCVGQENNGTYGDDRR